MPDSHLVAPRLTTTQFAEYLDKLNPKILNIYYLADRFFAEAADTIDDDFQIASEVIEVFAKYVRRKL